MPPDSFRKLIDDATAAAELAIADGNMLLEIEFPPLPTSKLEDSALSAYDILGANHFPTVKLPISSGLGNEALRTIHHEAVLPVIGHDGLAHDVDCAGFDRHHIHHQVYMLDVFEVRRHHTSCVDQ